MSSATYVIGEPEFFVTDGLCDAMLLHDIPNDPTEFRIYALAASGDYFETLAARLEQIAAGVPKNSVEQYQLQDAVTQLLYLQRNYNIQRKDAKK
jgi:uncharacterized protein YigA (DUF484 family)